MYSTSSNVVCVPTSLLTVSLPLFIVSFLVFAFLIYFYFMYFTVLLASFPFSVILIPFLELDGRNIWEKQNKECMCLCAYLYIYVCVKVDQLCPTLCDPMDCSLPGSSAHGILQTRILRWVAITSSMGSSQPRNQTGVSSIAGRFFTNWATREAHIHIKLT